MGRFIRRIAILAVLAGVAMVVARKLGLVGGGQSELEEYNWEPLPSDTPYGGASSDAPDVPASRGSGQTG